MSKIFFSIFLKTNLSAFRAAILANDTNRICRILDIERKHICKELDDEGNTALLLAIKYASPLTVCVLLEQGAHPDKSNCLDFQTPLSSLAARSYENTQSHEAKIALEMAMILLDHGAYIDKLSPYTLTDEDGESYSIKETPLMTAVRTKNLPMATLFVERRAHVNYVDKETQNRS
jgi:ankyrin repeat protein